MKKYRMMSVALAASVFLIGLPGCSSAEDEKKLDEPQTVVSLTPQELMQSPEVKEMIAVQTAVGPEVFAKMSESLEEGENLLMSPLSLSTVAAMLMNGASEEIRPVLQTLLKNMDVDDINKGYFEMMAAFSALDENVTFETANGLWADNSLPIELSYMDLLSTYYGGECENLDFNSENVPEAVNSWVNDKTHGHVPYIFASTEKLNTPFVLANAMYFMGKWSTAFNPGLTRPEGFSVGESSVPVDMMHAVEIDAGYRKAAGYEALTLPFGDGTYVMTFILPSEGRGVKDLASEMTAASLAEAVIGCSGRKADVSIPKFKIEDVSDMRSVFNNMGLNRIFETDRWPGITSAPLRLSRLIQKTAISIDENGGEGGAATVITGDIMPDPTSAQEKIVFKADRPFIFAIMHTRTLMPVFLGLMQNP